MKFVYFEILPSIEKKLRFGRKNREYNPAMPKEVKEKEEKEKKESVRVAEKILSNLELMGIKCPRCGSKNTKIEEKNTPSETDVVFLRCLDCKYEWKEKATT